MNAIAAPRASDPPSSDATVRAATAPVLGVDGATPGPRGGERHASAPLLGLSQEGRSARTSSHRKPIDSPRQVQRGQYVRTFQQAQPDDRSAGPVLIARTARRVPTGDADVNDFD